MMRMMIRMMGTTMDAVLSSLEGVALLGPAVPVPARETMERHQ